VIYMPTEIGELREQLALIEENTGPVSSRVTYITGIAAEANRLGNRDEYTGRKHGG
jgi:hypothetical protein